MKYEGYIAFIDKKCESLGNAELFRIPLRAIWATLDVARMDVSAEPTHFEVVWVYTLHTSRSETNMYPFPGQMNLRLV